MNEWALNMSHTVGSVSCLVVLCADTARRENRCPLYRVPLFRAQSHYKLVLIDLQNFANLIINFDWPPFQLWLTLFTNFYCLDYKTVTNIYHYKLLLTSLQKFVDLITKFHWSHYKLLLTSLQKFVDLITKLYWPHYKIPLISLQTFTDLITKLYWPHYKTLLTSLQNFTDLITNFY